MLFSRRVSPEEEEDRARTLLTRRRFLFMGAAAAGAVAARKILPIAPPEPTESVIGSYADYVTFSDLPVQAAIDRELAYRFNATFLGLLKTNVQLPEMMKPRLVPEGSLKTVQLFTYPLDPPELV